MRLNQIRDFIAVTQAGSLRAAALAVGVSQPAITKSIRQLELELGVQLLQRNARGAAATPAGKAFQRAPESSRPSCARRRTISRRSRAGATAALPSRAPAARMLIVPDAMVQFRRQHPHARVRIVEGTNTALLPLVRDETLDFSVGQSLIAKPDDAIKFRPLMRTPLVVAGRQGHPLRAAGLSANSPTLRG